MGPLKVIEAGAIPSVAAFEVLIRASLPVRHFHGSGERSPAFVGLAGLAGSALVWDDHGAHAQLVQLDLDLGLAVAAAGGDGARGAASAADDPPDRRGELGCVGGVAAFDAGRAPRRRRCRRPGPCSRLDRLAEPVLCDRAGIGVV
jgi:hypothetical protein